MILAQARDVLEVEAAAIKALAASLDDSFVAVVEALVNTKGRVILTGVGKSGIICRKIAATFASTGTPAFFLHPTEAIHGDLGMIVEGDLVIAISNSGETEELVRLLEYIKRQGARLIAITGRPGATLARLADKALVFTIEREGCPMGLAPMASTTTTLALGDALAAAVMARKGFTHRDFANFHPGGRLGKALLTVREAMSKHGKPLVSAKTPLGHVLIEISDKRLGMTAVTMPDGSLGLISDGDVRRLLQQHGKRALDLDAGSVATLAPKIIRAEALAVEALRLMETNKITSVIVVEGDTYAGVVHLHDLWQTQMI